MRLSTKHTEQQELQRFFNWERWDNTDVMRSVKRFARNSVASGSMSRIDRFQPLRSDAGNWNARSDGERILGHWCEGQISPPNPCNKSFCLECLCLQRCAHLALSRRDLFCLKSLTDIFKPTCEDLPCWQRNLFPCVNPNQISLAVGTGGDLLAEKLRTDSKTKLSCVSLHLMVTFYIYSRSTRFFINCRWNQKTSENLFDSL